MSSQSLPVRKAEDIILTQGDINLALGSGELKPCPFCGDAAMSCGEIITGGGRRAIRWTVQCLGSDGLIPNCFASVIAVDRDKSKARAIAVERWNLRNGPIAVNARSPYECYWSRRALAAEKRIAQLISNTP